MREIIYAVPAILLDQQIQPAIDALNNIDPAIVKAFMGSKSDFDREIRLQITDINEDRISDSDLFYLGMLFGINIKL
jgi:hypothetical protein